MKWLRWSGRSRVVAGLLTLAPGAGPRSADAQTCEEPPRISRAEIREAMRAHGPYSLTSTTTSMLFGSRALLTLIRQRQRAAPGSTQFLIDHADWFNAQLETAGVAYAEMSASARAGFEHQQDVLVDYGPGVVEEVLEGPAPITSAVLTIAWSDTAGLSPTFSYRDTLSVPKVDVFNDQVIRFTVLAYDSAVVFGEVTGISVRPMGFLSGLFGLIGKPDVKETRLAVADDYWQVVRGRVKLLPGISKTGTAFIEPGGKGHEEAPADRPDLRALAERLRLRVQLRYGPPSCQARLRMRLQQYRACHQAMGGLRSCPEPR